MQSAVIFDMDGTLADCRHRLHHLKGPGKKDWKAFFSGSKDDLPRLHIVRLAVELSARNAILIASGRPEHLRDVTEIWLNKYEIPHQHIYLRDDRDRRSDGVVKAEMLIQMKEHGYAPWLAIDDRESAVSAWREQGIVCLQCDENLY